MPLIEIYRSSLFATCEQRAFVLHAVGIPAEITVDNDTYTLWVTPEAAATAQHHLLRYDQESVPAPTTPPLELHAHAWIASAVYALILLITSYFAGQGSFSFDWYQAGALRNHTLFHGEWQRVITALTLHADYVHLLGNLGFGMYFSYLAARLLGWGIALASALFAAAMGNVLNSFLMPLTHTSIGASTLVFAALGLLAAYSWRRQFDQRLRWTHRWSPLIAGVMLLGLIGSGGENTDVLAHISGFFCGAVLGAAYGRVQQQLFKLSALQYSAAIVSIATFIGAWLISYVV